MTQVGNYTISKGFEGYALIDQDGNVVGLYGSAREAMDKGIALTAAAYKARTSA